MNETRLVHLGHHTSDHPGQLDKFVFVPLTEEVIYTVLRRDGLCEVLHDDGVSEVVTEEHGRSPHSDLLALEETPGLSLVSVLGQLTV